ncbi:MAG: multifunctional CCA tRNA nucleotidyl transferase/2'3'-cyclic phosphodiesterase/2'nucleotidase/phosphatase [Candidatus Thiodiazotropha sp.]
MKIYLVGGAVRDQLLDLPVTERDWVVVGASPEAMLAAGYRRADSEFPVFLHPETGEEFALARTEVKSGPGYKGFQVEYGPDITLEQDLLRRDLTINAMALSEGGDFIDVCGGRDDLENGKLRHITPAFTEDPVRLLRIARFAAKLGCWGFRVAHETHRLMKAMARSEELMSLNPERIWREMSRSLATPQPWRFFEVLEQCGALHRLLPELLVGTLAPAHGEQRRSEFMAPLRRVVKQSEDPIVRCGAALFESVAHSPKPDDWMQGLRIDKAGRQLLLDLLRFHRLSNDGVEAESILQFMMSLNPKQQAVRFRRFVQAAQGLWPQRLEVLLPHLEFSAELLSSPVPEELVDAGLEGKALGDALFAWRAVRLSEEMSQTGGSN